MAFNKEVVTYGFILLDSGVSELMAAPWIYGPFSLYIACVGMGLMVIGVLIIILGVLWRWGPWKRPLGISLLAVSCVFAGLVSIALGGWIFAPLFALALVFFIVAWAIFAGKRWAKTAIEIIAIIGFLASVFGISNDWVVNVPGVLGAIYVLWYVNRPYVAGYFNAEQRKIELGERRILLIIFFAFILLIPLTFLYMDPPSRRVADWMSGSGSPASGGVSGPEYVFHSGDVLTYIFQVGDDSSSIVFSIERQDRPEMTIATTRGNSGSGVTSVPLTGQYWVMATSLDATYSVHFEIIVKMFSIRRHILQWVLLDLLLMTTLFSIRLRRKQVTTHMENSKISMILKIF